MEKSRENSKEEKEIAKEQKLDTGLHCLVLIAKLNGISLDLEQIRHNYAISFQGISQTEIIRVSREISLKAKCAEVKYERLKKLQLPAMIQLKDGSYLILAKADKDKVLVLNPIENGPKVIAKEEFTTLWNKKIILFKSKKVGSSSNVKFGLKWFIPSILKYKKVLIEVLIAIFTVQLIGLSSPIITQVVIDKVLVHKGLTTLNVLMIALIVVACFEMILGICKNYVFTHTTNKIDVILSSRLFKHLFRLPLPYFESRRVGDTIARVREVENIRQFLTGAPLSSILDVMFLIVYIGIMSIYSWSLTKIVLSSIPLFIILSVIVTPMFKSRLDKKFYYGAENQSYLVEAVSGVQTIKSFALEPLSQKRWEDQLAKYVNASFKTSILAGTAGSIGQCIQRVTDLIILWIGARMVIDGQMTVGQLVAFRMLSGQVSSPILRLVQMWQEFQQISVSIERLGDIFNAQPEPYADVSKAKLPNIRGNIRFEKVRFRYHAENAEVIRNMSFDIEAGMVVGIVGRSGSGKSTLSKLIQRLYVPEVGKILIDGIDISLVDPSWLRRQIGVVLQENFLFNGSVRENISIHYPGASMDEIIRVAKVAGAHSFILELPQGYDTIVGEKGTSLSGGQKQRIAIARALLTNPKILIFDEATSALDYESESIIQKNLNMICRGRTVIIIAHRLSTIKDAHRVMVIDRGELVEAGSHKDLMERRGLYHYLFNQQQAKSIAEDGRGKVS